MVGVTFSGGGTRAASYGYGVLKELEATQITVQGRTSSVFDHIDLISGVSGGSVLAALGTRPERTLFVGDRVREDYEGPRALGMRAVIVTAHADENPPDGVAVIRSLAEVQPLV